MKIHNSEHFLSKYTNFPRFKLIKKIFPDAKFIHIMRDGRAVSFSYYNKMIKGEWNAWEKKDWMAQSWPEKWRNEFFENYHSKWGFSTFQWKYFLDEILIESKDISDDSYHEVQYDFLIENPMNCIEEILDICGVPYSKRMRSYISNMELKNMNYKWKKGFTKEQMSDVDNIINMKK